MTNFENMKIPSITICCRVQSIASTIEYLEQLRKEGCTHVEFVTSEDDDSLTFNGIKGDDI